MNNRFSGTVVLVATYASETSPRSVVTYLADGDPRRHPVEIRSIFHGCWENRSRATNKRQMQIAAARSRSAFSPTRVRNGGRTGDNARLSKRGKRNTESSDEISASWFDLARELILPEAVDVENSLQMRNAIWFTCWYVCSIN